MNLEFVHASVCVHVSPPFATSSSVFRIVRIVTTRRSIGSASISSIGRIIGNVLPEETRRKHLRCRPGIKFARNPRSGSKLPSSGVSLGEESRGVHRRAKETTLRTVRRACIEASSYRSSVRTRVVLLAHDRRGQYFTAYCCHLHTQPRAHDRMHDVGETRAFIYLLFICQRARYRSGPGGLTTLPGTDLKSY